MDFYEGSQVVAANYKPKWTIWNRKTVGKHLTEHKRRSRRIYKLYLKTGDIRDYNRSQRKITTWDFD